MAKKIVIGTDHGGYLLKEKVKTVLEKKKFRVNDLGCYSKEPCDYPVTGFEVAREVSLKKSQRGIVICKSGIGMSIVANKMPGVRAGLCLSVKDASSAREHNDTNVLVLPASKISLKTAMNIVETWLETKALKGRHSRRVRQISDMEKKVFKKVK